MKAKIESVLLSALGSISWSKFFPPLDAGGIGRCKKAEDAMLEALRVLREIYALPDSATLQKVWEALDREVVVKDYDTTSPTLQALLVEQGR